MTPLGPHFGFFCLSADSTLRSLSPGCPSLHTPFPKTSAFAVAQFFFVYTPSLCLLRRIFCLLIIVRRGDRSLLTSLVVCSAFRITPDSCRHAHRDQWFSRTILSVWTHAGTTATKPFCFKPKSPFLFCPLPLLTALFFPFCCPRKSLLSQKLPKNQASRGFFHSVLLVFPHSPPSFFLSL